ncbi:hypothetical protein A9264_15880 [Vibrio sp. UCD-FRSSP16_10]|nr:hypothetical protein A9260_15890 [Vibrio sp. UCD-FRSSP16_30]OBT18202.1 hypothetical protein A9264_15880 [Vibrio sp. UCD-FRSSP16_10]
MNRTQKNILIITVVCMLLMTIFPPFYAIYKSNSINFGYSFIFNPPRKIAIINVATLFIQYFIAGIIGFALVILNNEKKQQ